MRRRPASRLRRFTLIGGGILVTLVLATVILGPMAVELVFVLFLFVALPAAAAAGLIELITRRLRDGRSAKGDPAARDYNHPRH
jgi:hypothetical protein